MGEKALRNIFLKTSNIQNGKYFAEILRESFDFMEQKEYVFSEPRLSIYGDSVRLNFYSNNEI